MTFTLKYQALNQATEDIRLIKVLPAEPCPTAPNHSESIRKQDRDIVSCQLSHFPLRCYQTKISSSQLDWEIADNTSISSKIPLWRYTWGDYAALSYTWGNPLQTRDILINGHKVTVRSNLEAGLRALRERNAICAGLLIWFDALCINQEDILERSEEVKRMRMIYKTAREVVIWLGEEGNGSSKAMELIKTLSKACDEGNSQTLENLIEKSPEVFGKGVWKALGQLMLRPYWDRVWIMQELAMGNPQTPVLCGKDMVKWGDIYHGIYTFGTQNIKIFSYIGKECKEAGVTYSGLNRNKIIHLWYEQEVQAGRMKPQLMAMLDLSRKSMATDSKDKIYGLMGLMDLEVAGKIEPDYGKVLMEVYRSFAKVVITATCKLEILEQCTWPNPHMPSWVPDWNNKNHFRLFSGRSTYHAVLGRPPIFQFSANNAELSVQGFKIGDIDGLGASYYETYTSTEGDDILVQPTGSNNAYGTYAGLRDAVWRVLIGNRIHPNKVASEEHAALLQCSLELEEQDPAEISRGRKAFNLLLKQNKELRVAGRPLSTFFPATGIADPEKARSALEQIFRLHRSRRLAITISGHLGLVPIAVRKGDLVFLLLGCNVPTILRKAEVGKYHLIGGCYLHGFMEGEAMEDLHVGNVQLETICLQ